jgi:hypothetical protein
MIKRSEQSKTAWLCVEMFKKGSEGGAEPGKTDLVAATEVR